MPRHGGMSAIGARMGTKGDKLEQVLADVVAGGLVERRADEARVHCCCGTAGSSMLLRLFADLHARAYSMVTLEHQEPEHVVSPFFPRFPRAVPRQPVVDALCHALRNRRS